MSCWYIAVNADDAHRHRKRSGLKKKKLDSGVIQIVWYTHAKQSGEDSKGTVRRGGKNSALMKSKNSL